MLRARRIAAFAGLAFALSCSAKPGTVVSAQEGVWYETTLDRDTSYLPMGKAEVEVQTAVPVPAEAPFAMDLYLPRRKEAAPLVLFLPGAFVQRDRYFWLGQTLASHGVAVAVVEPAGGFNKSFHATATLDALAALGADGGPLAGRIDRGRIVLAGHSQGALTQAGVADVGSCAEGFCAAGMRSPDGVRGLLLLGYHGEDPDRPERNTTPIGAAEVPWLILTGSADQLTTREKAERTLARLQDRPVTLVEIQGMNHFQFTDYVDPARDRALPRDGLPTVASKDARALAATYALRFVQRVLFGEESVGDDYGAADDRRVRVVARSPRIKRLEPGGLPRVLAEPVGVAGLDGRVANSDIVATAAFEGATYLLVRNDATGAELWRLRGATLEPAPAGGTRFGGPRLNGLLGALAVYKGKLYIGVSSGVQGGTRGGSTGAEVWAYDGASFEPIVARAADADTAITAAAVEGCGTAQVTLTIAETLAPGAWSGGHLDDVETTAGEPGIFEVIGNTETTVTLRVNDVSAATDESVGCDALASGKRLHLRRGTDEAGFGQPWNKAITAMAVLGDTLYVASGLNYDAGAEVYATRDGRAFEVALPRAALGSREGKPISSSVTALAVSALEGSPALYVAANGTDNYGARLLRLDGDKPAWLVDAAADADDRGLDEAGFGRGTTQITSIVEHDGRLWLGGFDYKGAEVFSLEPRPGSSPSLRVEAGAGERVGRGFGDDSQIIAQLASFGGHVWVGTVAYVRRETDLQDLSALGLRTNGKAWQTTTAHAYGVNAVGVSRYFVHDGRLHAVASGGALTARVSYGGVRLYELREEKLP